MAWPYLILHLGPLFWATFSLSYYPNQWKTFKMVVMHKPGKPNYCIPKAHHPIALMDCLSKILTAYIIEEFSYQVEQLHMLPVTQFGGWAYHPTVGTLHQIIDCIKAAWCGGNIMSFAFLNIKSAFSSVIQEVLIHDMSISKRVRLLSYMIRLIVYDHTCSHS